MTTPSVWTCPECGRVNEGGWDRCLNTYRGNGCSYVVVVPDQDAPHVIPIDRD